MRAGSIVHAWHAIKCGRRPLKLDVRQPCINSLPKPLSDYPPLPMQTRITPLRVLLGVGITALFVLMSIGNVSSGKWSALTGWVFGLSAPLMGFGFALTAGFSSPTSTTADASVSSEPAGVTRRFRTRMLMFVASVLVFLVLFRVLDFFHIQWQRYLL
jgi:hypothetical protein